MNRDIDTGVEEDKKVLNLPILKQIIKIWKRQNYHLSLQIDICFPLHVHSIYF